MIVWMWSFNVLTNTKIDWKRKNQIESMNRVIDWKNQVLKADAQIIRVEDSTCLHTHTHKLAHFWAQFDW